MVGKSTKSPYLFFYSEPIQKGYDKADHRSDNLDSRHALQHHPPAPKDQPVRHHPQGVLPLHRPTRKRLHLSEMFPGSPEREQHIMRRQGPEVLDEAVPEKGRRADQLPRICGLPRSVTYFLLSELIIQKCRNRSIMRLSSRRIMRIGSCSCGGTSLSRSPTP